MPLGRLKTFLDEHKIKYMIIQHSTAYTTPEIAALAHIPGKELAKTVIVKIDGKLAMAVLPASYRIDFTELAEALSAKKIDLASEDEFEKKFDDCETGAMPPFGNLYKMEVYVAESLTEDNEITFNACSHRELIKMNYKDFEKLVKPKIIKFSYQY
ncbi:MAG: YbaK/EbsC family protein [Calditrichales bacterium]|nr:MAG: YbaK/EbsC family protein [Calditrichales bacterium]